MNYSIDIARHRFSLWAACRAAQAGSAKARRHELVSALETCGVVSWIADTANHSAGLDDYDREFDNWVTKAQKRHEEEFRKQALYGVVAKLVSTYLKSAFVLGGHETTALAGHITPPIDSILLKGIDVAHKTPLSKKYKWQKLTQQEYKDVVRELRKIRGARPMWHIEQYWKP